MMYKYLLILPLVLLASCSQPVSYQISGKTMGTDYSVTLFAGSAAELAGVQSEIEALFADISAQVSNWDPNSEISQFNSADAPYTMEVSEHFVRILSISKAINNLTEGAFDPAFGALIDVWGFGVEGSSRVPSVDEIQSALKEVGADKLGLATETGELTKKSSCILNVSGVAKGYAVDRVAQLLDSKSIKHYLINIGGEVRAKGKNGERFWTVGIEHPDSTQSLIIESFGLENTALATSGNYRKFFKADGKHYSHIIDPRTGYPISEDRVSVSVLGGDCATADALATAFLVMRVDEALKLSDSLDQIEVLFVTRCSEGTFRLHKSKGWPEESAGRVRTE